MNKQEFMRELQKRLSGLPQEDVRERLDFYGEMIDDCMEEGLSEEAAVLQIGSVDKIAEQILSEIPLSRLAKEKIKSKRKMRPWEIVLLAAGSPVWLVLGIAALIIVIALYAVLWSLIGSLWAVFGALAGVGGGGVVLGGMLMCLGNVLPGIALIGASMVCAGLSVFSFFGCLAATKGAVFLTRGIALGIKRCFLGKEATK